MCVCGVNYRASKETSPYFTVVSAVPFCTIFLQSSHQGHDFQKDVGELKVFVLLVSKNSKSRKI
jgi:hypothetical protein